MCTMLLSRFKGFKGYSSKTVPIILFLFKISTYYSSIILNSFGYLLFPKLCWHNLSRPTADSESPCSSDPQSTSMEHVLLLSSLPTVKEQLKACCRPTYQIRKLPKEQGSHSSANLELSSNEHFLLPFNACI